MNSSESTLTRRSLLLALAGSLPGLALAEALQPGATPDGVLRIAATWRGPRETDPYSIGMLGFDPAARTLRVLWQQQLPGRAHGLATLADGSLIAIAVRPGHWLQRYSTEGALLREVTLDGTTQRHFTGHAVASRDGRLLLTGETDPRDDRGFIGVRDAATFEELSTWPSGGVEPHDLRLDASGALIVANGGIRRAAGDRKRDLDRMESSIARLDTTTGRLLGQWQLQDPRLQPAAHGLEPHPGRSAAAGHWPAGRTRRSCPPQPGTGAGSLGWREAFGSHPRDRR